MKSIFLIIFLNSLYVLTKSTNPRSVNVALETSLLFQPGEENNFSFINKIRKFINQIEQAISPVREYLRTTDEKTNSKIFSKFMEKIITNIIKYDDNDLKTVAKALANEAENILHTNEVFTESNKEAILNVLKEYSRVNAKQIRYNLRNALNGNEVIITRLVDNIDNYYDDNDKAKLDDLIEKSEKFAKGKSENAKTDVKNMIKDFMNILKDKYDTLDETTKIQLNRNLSIILQFIDLNKIFKPHDSKELESKRKLFKSHANTTKSENFKNEKDIIINKDIEIFVRSVKNANDDSDKVNGKNHSIEDDAELQKLENQSVDLSTVLDELNKS